LFEAWCGVSWSVTNLALTVGATPVAQWSRWITPFGVSGLLYMVNFTLVREHAPNFGRRWLGPALGVGIAVLAWCGGRLIAATVSVEPLPFSVLLVQPHVKGSHDKPWRPWVDLDRITRTSLLRDEPVDLVVWPESSLSESWSCGESEVADMATRLTVHDFSHLLTPVYKTNCLVGVTILERGTTQRYGLEVADVRRYNCGCLVSESGEIARHEKLALVPLKEGLPALLDHSSIRSRVLSELQLDRPLAPGREFGLLSFRDRQGKARSIAVSVCYESLLPWLPQYHESTTVDAIVHLVYDGNSAAHPGMIERQIRACQYRAIETRKWNLVCSTWTGSAIIDPSGKIVSQLAATAGALRSDAVDGKGN
jgi:apolipoprotein N-acyltransferase